MIWSTYFSNVWDVFKTRDLRRIAHTLIKTTNIRRICKADVEMQIKRKSEIDRYRKQSDPQAASRVIRVHAVSNLCCRYTRQIRSSSGNYAIHAIWTLFDGVYYFNGILQMAGKLPIISLLRSQHLRVSRIMFYIYLSLLDSTQTYLSWDNKEKDQSALKII